MESNNKSTPTLEKVQPKMRKSERIPMHSTKSQNTDGLDVANFHYRWCCDYDQGKLGQYLAAGWEFALDDEGNQRKRPGGQTLVLMRLPMEFYEEDRLVKRGKIIDTNEKFKAEHGVSTNLDYDEDVPEYLAKDQNVL
jgi:hypothetical protein